MRIKSFILKKLGVRGRNVEVGKGFHVGPFSRIWAPSKLTIGKNVYVGKFVTIEVDGSIGNGVLIANSVGILGRRDHNFREIGVSIRNSEWVGTCNSLSSPVHIQSDVWIGFGAIVLGPLTIGHSSIIAAGSVVTKDIKPFSIVAGNPASIIGMRFTSELEREEHTKKLRESDWL